MQSILQSVQIDATFVRNRTFFELTITRIYLLYDNQILIPELKFIQRHKVKHINWILKSKFILYLIEIINTSK